jgi:alkylation response protein AidB-like acyl-CoA dehydrogenase
MYVDLTSAQHSLRQQIREYFTALMTPEAKAAMADPRTDVRVAEYRRLVRCMGADGWLAVGWPKQYGGKGYTPLDQLIFFEEAFLAGATLPFVTINTVGPALMARGSDAHKREFLPGMAAGEIHFCIGYTEAGAGTDLAALTTSAVQRGDHFVVNGSKVFTTDAEAADYIWLAARTDPTLPRHKGISILIVDAKSPGFSYTPIDTIGHPTNATFYDDIEVPATRLVGELNGGWQLITAQLNHERIGLGALGVLARGSFERVLAWARTETDGRRPIDTPWVAATLADSYRRLEAMRLINYRLAAELTAQRMDIGLASGAKVFGTEAMVTVYRQLLEVVGMGGLYRAGSAAAELAGALEHDYRSATINTFGGGVNELLRDHVAQYGLGMPRPGR